MAYPKPKDCFTKWVIRPAELADWLATNAATLPVPVAGAVKGDKGMRMMLNDNRDLIKGFTDGLPKDLKETFFLYLDGKITPVRRTDKDLKKDAETIQEYLSNCSQDEQCERDIALWYGQCTAAGDKGKDFVKRIFSTMNSVGVLYRKKGGKGWADFSTLKLPIATLLSHGGRILILLPMSNSALRAVKATLLATPKAILQILNPNAILRTSDSSLGGGGGKAKKGLKLVVATLENAVHEAVGALGPKPAAAGDDRFFDWFSAGTLHKRIAASHSTILRAIDDKAMEDLPCDRFLWIEEEKAGKGSNVWDSLCGRHLYKDMALGGVGNMNPYSGVTVDKKGGHGHMYTNYRAPRYKIMGSLLVGCEGSAPKIMSQFGKAHDAKATKGKFSATGGLKWGEFEPKIYEHKKGTKGHATMFVCDLTDLHTSLAKKTAEKGWTENNLHEPPNKVKKANWDEMMKRVGGD